MCRYQKARLKALQEGLQKLAEDNQRQEAVPRAHARPGRRRGKLGSLCATRVSHTQTINKQAAVNKKVLGNSHCLRVVIERLLFRGA